MTNHPIIFSAPMVRALLEGHKTQTRRMAFHDPKCRWCKGKGFTAEGIVDNECDKCTGTGRRTHVPTNWQKVRPGDLLWVRESFATTDSGPIRYAATDDIHELRKLTPGIHMPRSASRLTLEVTATKVEPLQKISKADAITEGATSKPALTGYNGMDAGWSMDWKIPYRDHALGGPREAFGAFINELHGGKNWNLKPSNLWAENPEVVALTFIVHKCNIDALKAAA